MAGRAVRSSAARAPLMVDGGAGRAPGRCLGEVPLSGSQTPVVGAPWGERPSASAVCYLLDRLVPRPAAAADTQHASFTALNLCTDQRQTGQTRPCRARAQPRPQQHHTWPWWRNRTQPAQIVSPHVQSTRQLHLPKASRVSCRPQVQPDHTPGSKQRAGSDCRSQRWRAFAMAGMWFDPTAHPRTG